MARNGKLTPKEAKFVEEYLIDLNATAAAKRAGYSKKTAEQIGFYNLRKPKIQDALNVARQKMSVETGVTPEKVIQELSHLAFSNIADCYTEDGQLKNIYDIPEAARQAIAGIEVEELFEGRGEDREHIGTIKKLKRWDKVRALENLCKHFGLLNADASKSPVSVSLNMVFPDEPEQA